MGLVCGPMVGLALPSTNTGAPPPACPTRTPGLHRGDLWREILAFIQTGNPSAGPEGTDRVVKTVTRDAYGFHNPA
ncbi:hypothetical protein ACTMTI_13910 [Nonomuraea sp. H19]|uniref:hypothetical protein n=1 Tax=Nonomuraea sp. H19 TaxID=3452206 RepID=UPI003F8CDDCB